MRKKIDLDLSAAEISRSRDDVPLKIVTLAEWETTPVVYPPPLRELARGAPLRKLWAHLWRTRQFCVGIDADGNEPRMEFQSCCLIHVGGFHCAGCVYFALKDLAGLDLIDFWYTPTLSSFVVRFEPRAVPSPTLN